MNATVYRLNDDVMDLNTKLMKARGILNLRGAWEWYENQRSVKKARNSRLGRRETWEDLLSSRKFDDCFANNTDQLDKLLGAYAKLSSFVLFPDLDVVVIERSKFDDEELCVIKKMLEDLKLIYEVYELGMMVERYPSA